MCLYVRTFIIAIALVSGFARLLSAQEINSFASSAETPTGDFGWDVFTGGYSDIHEPEFSSGIGVGEILIGGTPPAMPPGGITSNGNIYTHDAGNPSLDISLTGLEITEAFTSVVVQYAVATSGSVDASDFTLGGVAPDEFIFLGQNGTVDFGQTAIPNNFYWAEWIGVDSLTSYNASINVGSFRVVTGAKASYFNTSAPLNVTSVSAVPEPSLGVLPLLFGALAVRRRRR